MRSAPLGARHAKRRAGALMMATSLVTALVLSVIQPAGVAEATAAEEDGSSGQETEPLETQQQGYYNAPVFDILPPTVVSEFPPGVVCIVEPRLCPEAVDPASEVVEGGLGEVEANEPAAPADPVPPQTLPVSIVGGVPRYRAAVQFSLPPVPDGQQVDTFKVVLAETAPTYSSSSPMFRQAVLAAMASVRGFNAEEFQKIITQGCEEGEDGPCPIEQDPLPVEMCPIVGDWEGAPSQPQEKLPEVDCLYGSNGQRLESGDWEFDLTYAAQAWASGELENRGVLIRPQRAPNVAYGDPDPSYNKQVTFESTVLAAMTASEESEPLSLGSDLDSSSGSGSMTATPPTTTSVGSSAGSGSFGAPMQSTPEEQAASPQVAAPGTDAVAIEQPAVAAGAMPAPTTPWWTWMLAPVFLGGAYLLTRSLTAPVEVATARAGAMSRLIAMRTSSASDVPELV